MITDILNKYAAEQRKRKDQNSTSEGLAKSLKELKEKMQKRAWFIELSTYIDFSKINLILKRNIMSDSLYFTIAGLIFFAAVTIVSFLIAPKAERQAIINKIKGN